MTSSASSALDRRNFIALLTAAGATAALATPALAKLAFTNADPDLIFAWEQLKPGIHAFADQSTGGNTLIAVSKDQALLIDTKFAHLANALKADAFALSESAHLDLTLINTHHHGDHAGGNALIVPIATASYAHKNALPRIAAQLDKFQRGAQSGPSQINRSKGSDQQLKLAIAAADASDSWTEKSITPTHAVDNKKSISIADIALTMHHFGPGHTDNDLVIHFQDHNIIHTGDLVFNTLHPYFDPSAGVTAVGWTKSLKATLNLCDKHTKVIPGHGPLGNKQTIQTQLNYIEQLIEHVQADIDAGIPKSETAAKTWPFMKNLGFESIRSRAIEATYDELAN